MCLGFLGTYMLGKKNKYAFIVLFGSIVCWMILGIYIKSIPLVLSGVVNSILRIRNFVIWSKNERQKV